ncbi:hypothetical protein HPB52_023193 [Rhipicephalus sanguineus]|uniref:C2H2-type domain-containing protein n=1 Tax=Rhipicephalus sanguineus TaxID=34632 RepID=A0A9D4QC96_RHISA|nr:hypothetical protein HPB52_023193 [Rhipicephalus sanguineus]
MVETACVSTVKSLQTAFEVGVLTSGVDAEVAWAAVCEIKSEGAWTASLGTEVASTFKAVKSKTRAGVTPVDESVGPGAGLGSEPEAAVAEAAERETVRPLRSTVCDCRSSSRGGPRRNQDGPGARTTGPYPLGGRSRPADQPSTHYWRSGFCPPQDEETTGRGLRKRLPPFLACLSQPGCRCLRTTTTGPGPRESHRRHLGLPGPAGTRTSCCPDLLPGLGCPAPEEDAYRTRGPGPATAFPERSHTTAAYRAVSVTTRTCSGGFADAPRAPTPSAGDPRLHHGLGQDPPPPLSATPKATGAFPGGLPEQPEVEPRPPVLDHGVLTVDNPVPGTLHCPHRGCAAVYTTKTCSLRVRYLKRHLEGAHGVAVGERVTVYAGCAAPLPAQPQRHSCGADEPPASTSTQPGLVCSRCPREFRMQQLLHAHLRWHDLHDVADPVARVPLPLSGRGRWPPYPI